jgi:hypothetical protein
MNVKYTCMFYKKMSILSIFIIQMKKGLQWKIFLIINRNGKDREWSFPNENASKHKVESDSSN